jgi:hypothetical protein
MPVISANLPTVPEVGVNEVIEGRAIKFKQTGISLKNNPALCQYCFIVYFFKLFLRNCFILSNCRKVAIAPKFRVLKATT